MRLFSPFTAAVAISTTLSGCVDSYGNLTPAGQVGVAAAAGIVVGAILADDNNHHHGYKRPVTNCYYDYRGYLRC